MASCNKNLIRKSTLYHLFLLACHFISPVNNPLSSIFLQVVGDTNLGQIKTGSAINIISLSLAFLKAIFVASL